MQSRRYLLLAMLFGALIASILSIVALRQLVPALANVLMFLVGLFAMTFLSAFHRLIDSAGRSPIIQITFNEGLASSQLATAAKSVGIEVIDAEVVRDARPEGDVPPEYLLGQNNSLALAKLRMDIERELRRIAIEAGLGNTTNRLGIRPLADELTKRDKLDPAVNRVLDEILPAVNDAIHGREVSTDTASTILRVGRQLVGVLRANAEKNQRGL
jgi:hypothetical protein